MLSLTFSKLHHSVITKLTYSNWPIHIHYKVIGENHVSIHNQNLSYWIILCNVSCIWWWDGESLQSKYPYHWQQAYVTKLLRYIHTKLLRRFNVVVHSTSCSNVMCHLGYTNWFIVILPPYRLFFKLISRTYINVISFISNHFISNLSQMAE